MITVELVTASILKPFIHFGIEILGAMAKFFTIHFAKAMTLTGLAIAFVFLIIFMGTKSK